MPPTIRLTGSSATLVPYGSELALPDTFQMTVDGYPYSVVVDLAADAEGGGPRITSLSIGQLEGGPPLDTEGLRRLPLARLRDHAVELAAYTRLRDLEGQPVPFEMGAASFASGPELRRAKREIAGSKRRWLMTDEHLADVARVYLANPRNAQGRRAPTAAVEQHFKVPRSTASRWVAAARQRHPDLFAQADKQRTSVLQPPKKGKTR